MTAVVSPVPLSFGRYRARTVLVALIVALVLGLLWEFAPNFFKINNLINILVQAATLAVMAVGMSVVMIGGGIDLSLPFNAAVSAVLGAMYMRATGDVIVGSLIMLAAATAIGLFNGAAVGYLGMIPFVVTLAMMSITAGSAVWLTNSISISHLPAGFIFFFRMRPAGLPIPVIVGASVCAIAAFLISRSVFARQLYAVGSNARAATIARVPTTRVSSSVMSWQEFRRAHCDHADWPIGVRVGQPCKPFDGARRRKRLCRRRRQHLWRRRESLGSGARRRLSSRF